MILFPPAKINLGLDILGKRSDGYHSLETCMVAVDITDVLEILSSNDFHFSHSGISIDGPTENNLIVKAFNLMQSEYNVPNVKIHLQKNIPMGAGLGGGSSDATSTLIGLNKMFNLGVTNDVLKDMASELGSDCAFFVENSIQIGTGKGDVLNPVSLDLDGYYLRIINPGIHIGTKEAYTNLRFSPDDHCIEDIIELPVSEWKGVLKNDFENSAFSNHEILPLIKERLYNDGAIYASMTGSGSTMYGIYNELPILWNDSFYERIVEM